MTCLEKGWIVRLIWREERDDLRKTTLTTLIKVLTKHWMTSGKEYSLNLQTKELKYYNGSKILFVPLKQQPSDPEFNWLWSYEITYWFVDEAQQVSRKAIDIILSRCTEKIKEYDLVWKVIMTCNPMKCHLYNDFIKPYYNNELPYDRIFIPSLYTDNPFIDHKKYKESLKRADKITKERLLKWNREYDDNPTKLYQYDKILELFTNQWEYWNKYITADIARFWDDKTVCIVRDWRIARVFSYTKNSTKETSNIIRWLQQKYWVTNENTVCDEDWVWWWVVDQLWCKWFINNASPLLSEKEKELRNYKNLKDQCYFELEQIINSDKIKIIISNDNEKESIIEELDVIKQKNPDKWGKLQINTKEEIKQLIWRSPDYADAIAMRMYFELKKDERIQIFFI